MRHGFSVNDERIVKSFLDTDFYKFTMGDFIFGNPCFADAEVTFRLKCRTKGVKLGKVIPAKDLEIELDHVMCLTPTSSEIYYLRGMDVYGDRMLSEAYLQFLKTIKLPPYRLEITDDGDLNLEFTGPWKTVTYWEIPALAVINELYQRYSVSRGFFSKAERERYFFTGFSRLLDKIARLRQFPELTFSDFGTRRRASRGWHDGVLGIIASQLPGQFRGSSNVYLAAKYNLVPIGTSAHELFMTAAGLADIELHGMSEAIRVSQNEILRGWWKKYGFGLSIALTDTYGTKFAFETAPSETAVEWKGTRQDSGDPFKYGEKAIDWHKRHGADPKKKMIVFSDGLDVEKMIKLHRHFRGRIIETFGWGTNLTNDFEPRPGVGLIPLSLVIKPVSVNGRGLVKLSDNIAKAIGAPEDIARYKKIFDYDETYFEACTY